MSHTEATENVDAVKGVNEPAKDVDLVNTIKTDLSHHVEQMMTSSNLSYKKHFEKIYEALTNLGELEINVGTLHATKIGKLMTKYERDLPKKLADVAKENNGKWKLLLNEYRERFKKKKYKKISEVSVKEEPLSDESYNELVASQEFPSDFSEFSQNLLLANSPEHDFTAAAELQVDSDLVTSTPMESGRNGVNKITTNNFLSDMRDAVDSLTNSLSSVETECMKIKTMLEYVSNKLNDFEESSKIDVVKKTVPVKNVQHMNAKESFVRTGKAVMPSLLSPPKNNGLNTGKNQVTNSTETVTTQVSKPSPTDNLISTNTCSKKGSSYDSLPKGSEHAKRKETSGEKHQAGVGAVTSTGSLKKSKANHLLINVASLTNGNASKPVVKNSKCSETITTAQISEARSTKKHFVNREDDNNDSLNSSYSSDNDTTVSYPLNTDVDDEPDIQFYLHDNANNSGKSGQNGQKNKKSFETDTECLKSLNEQIDSVMFKKKKPDIDKNKDDEIHDKIRKQLVAGEYLDKISSISKKLKRKSGELSNSSSVTEEIRSEKKSNKDVILPRNSVFEMDADGFTIPMMISQNEVQGQDDTVLLKGQQIDAADAGVDLDNVELEPFFTYSQVVNDMDDEIDDIEKDYLLSSKKNRTSWNNSCKKQEGVRFSPCLVKSKGRLKAAHKESVGKEVVHDMLRKNKNHKS